MRGRDKGTDIETFQKLLSLTRGTGVWGFGFYQNYYITSAEYVKYEYYSVFILVCIFIRYYINSDV